MGDRPSKTLWSNPGLWVFSFSIGPQRQTTRATDRGKCFKCKIMCVQHHLKKSGKNAWFALFKTSAKLQLSVLFDLEKKIVVKPNIQQNSSFLFQLFFIWIRLCNFLKMDDVELLPAKTTRCAHSLLFSPVSTNANPSWGYSCNLYLVRPTIRAQQHCLEIARRRQDQDVTMHRTGQFTASNGIEVYKTWTPMKRRQETKFIFFISWIIVT